jgi:hypothetical protein
MYTSSNIDNSGRPIVFFAQGFMAVTNVVIDSVRISLLNSAFSGMAKLSCWQYLKLWKRLLVFPQLFEYNVQVASIWFRAVGALKGIVQSCNDLR